MTLELIFPLGLMLHPSQAQEEVDWHLQQWLRGDQAAVLLEEKQLSLEDCSVIIEWSDSRHSLIAVVCAEL